MFNYIYIACTVDNCFSCVENSINKCGQCQPGFFLSNYKCVDMCPMGYRADRINWSCFEYPVTAWYWIKLSKSTCKNNCNTTATNKNSTVPDCSCSSECFRRGDCCEDIDLYCVDFIILRKNGLQN